MLDWKENAFIINTIIFLIIYYCNNKKISKIENKKLYHNGLCIINI